MAKYDVAVIGAGPGGYVAALRAAVLGAKTCIIERKHLGGSCLNVGCIPTKALLRTSEIYDHLKTVAEYGLSTGGTPGFKYSEIMKRTRQVVQHLVGGVGQLLKARKVDVIKGSARLLGEGLTEVTTAEGQAERLSAENIIIATGSVPARPAMFPFDGKLVATTDETTVNDFLPDEILVVGGGIIGCEFVTIYAELGCKVTVVEMLESLCPTVDKDIGREITRVFKKRGVQILTSTKVTEMKVDGDRVLARLDNGSEVRAGMALIAVGREPVTTDLGLEAAGVKTDGKLIKADARCRTNVPGIYAIGDCACTQQYAHVASRMGIVAAENACGHPEADDLRVVPTGIYTHPEAGMVGLSEEQAKAAGREVKVAKFSLAASGMARAYGQPIGLAKLVADARTGEILGAVCVGQHATDTIHEVAVAMRHELTVHEVAEAIHAHPTFAEAIGEAAELWIGKPVHTLG